MPVALDSSAATSTSSAGVVDERAAAPDWHEANRQHLSIAFSRLRALLEAYVAADPEAAAWRPDASFAHSYVRGTPVGGRPMALDHAAGAFGLSHFERDLLLLAAGIELDHSIGRLCAQAQRGSGPAAVTFALALSLIPGAHLSALSPGAALRRWRMLELSSAGPLTTTPLRIDERVVQFLAGVDAPDAQLDGVVTPIASRDGLAPAHARIAERIVAAWRQALASPVAPIVQLRGVSTYAKRAIAAAASRAVGLSLRALAVDGIPPDAAAAARFARHWERESALARSALLIECDDLDADDRTRAATLARFLDTTRGVLLVSTREPRRIGTRPTVGLEVESLSSAEQRLAWQQALGAAAAPLDGQVDQLVAQFDLTPDRIQDAVVFASSRFADGADEAASGDLGRALWDACRDQSRPRLEDLAQRMQSGAAWEQLVLPEPECQLLHDVAAHVRHRSTVYETWGFGRGGARGLGISALFAGPSGTGKTMAAEVIANELRLDLYRVDLSSVVSKYIGETEKNLRRIFDAAEEGGAVLLFDEADALFGKRSEVKDSHDRYANIEVSYLLQRMECYRGLAILTTNLRSALDVAFLRRLRFVVQFPFPDARYRAEIWRRVFPPATPLDGVDPERLAGLNVAGGNIKNIALNAAFLAADAREPVRMTHLLRAARSEYAKLEKPLTEAEIEGWLS